MNDHFAGWYYFYILIFKGIARKIISHAGKVIKESKHIYDTSFDRPDLFMSKFFGGGVLMFKNFIIISIIFFLPSLSISQEGLPVSVQDMVFCKAIHDRSPMDIDINFANSIERVYCFTKLSSELDTTSISHVWYYNDTQMAIVDLDINAKSWRTWSSKRIVKEWTGPWRVDVISSEGNILSSKEFQVRSHLE